MKGTLGLIQEGYAVYACSEGVRGKACKHDGIGKYVKDSKSRNRHLSLYQQRKGVTRICSHCRTNPTAFLYPFVFASATGRQDKAVSWMLGSGVFWIEVSAEHLHNTAFFIRARREGSERP